MYLPCHLEILGVFGKAYYQPCFKVCEITSLDCNCGMNFLGKVWKCSGESFEAGYDSYRRED